MLGVTRWLFGFSSMTSAHADPGSKNIAFFHSGIANGSPIIATP